MENERERYVSPFTDFGFKRLFGEEANKDLLLDFLNEILREEEGRITEIQYVKSEQLGRSAKDRKAVFDIHCKNERGERFIVEMQKTKQQYFKDRSLYYSTFPIQQQAEKNEWNYELKSVYTIAILNFNFDDNKDEKDKFRYDIKLTDIDTNKVFYNKLTFIYFEMPKFNKSIDELENKYEKWLFLLKNLQRLQSYPEKLQEKIFDKVFEVAEISKFTVEEYFTYQESLKVQRDNKNAFDTAVAEAEDRGEKRGEVKGRKEEKIYIAKKLLQAGVSIEVITATTGLSVEDIEKLRKN